jgi:LPXTG-site transpeptidase (sortase) family protein
LAIILIVVINFPAIKSLTGFWYSTSVSNQSYENPKIEKVVSKTATAASILPEIPNNSIYIDKIQVTAPISFDVPNETGAVTNGLQQGVIHLQNTAHPGETGNVFITGHSSNYFWEKGNYNTIFARLNNLTSGDNISINYHGAIYIYKVTDKFVVSPSDISVLKQNSDSKLTLMTCYPVGTNLKRLIVIANQAAPDAKSNIARQPSALDYLPDIRR